MPPKTLEERGNASCSSDEEEFDDFGFAVRNDDPAFLEASKSFASRFQPKALRRRNRLELRRAKLAGDWSSLPKKALKELLRKGVPAEHRQEIWWSVLGCEEKRRVDACGGYAGHTNGMLNVKTAEDIDRDLHRTFPSHQRFRGEEGRQSLCNVLRAFAHYAPRIQYCQGLNFIAALFLIVFDDEERAFWALISAFDRIDVEDYYTERMSLLRCDMRVLLKVLSARCPKVAKAFQQTGIELTSICSEWYITWFANCLPVQTVLRMWDTLFFEGFKVLFRVSIGIFKQSEADILQNQNFEDIMQGAKHWPRRLVDHNDLHKCCFRGLKGFSRKDLVQLREEAVCEVDHEDDDRRRRIEEARTPPRS